MRIFVTGGTGFIGAYFIRRAQVEGHDVCALRRKTGVLPGPAELGPKWIEGELADDHSEELRNCHALVHFAAAGVSPQHATVQTMFDVNVNASLQLWQQAVRNGVGNLVICGSCFEYGRSADGYESIPASAPLIPVTGYGASKAAATLAALALARESNARVQILRPFTVFGEGQHVANFWPALKAAALAGQDFPMTPGEQWRDFISADELASRFLAALGAPAAPGVPTVRNVGSGRPLRLVDFATEWWAHWGARGRLQVGALPYRTDEVMRYVPQLDGQGFSTL